MENDEKAQENKQETIAELKKDISAGKREELIDKVKKWVGKRENQFLLVALIFALAVSLYYFNVTQNQPVWWDEGEYLSIAKHWAFNVPYDINPQRPVLYPFLAFLIFKLGLGELTVKLLLNVLPFLLSILFFYLLVGEMYDKKTGIIAAAILSVSWIHLFYNMRFMTDSISFLFGVLAFYCFWKGYVNNKGKIYIWLIGLFIALAFLARLTGILYGVFIIAFLIATLNFGFLKRKDFWISILIFLLVISPYLLWSYGYYGNAFAFRSGYGGVTESPLGWGMISLLYDYPEFGFFVMFLFGVLTLIPMFLYLDHLILKKNKKYYADFFMFSLIVLTLAFFIYFLRSAENRWLMMMSIGIFALVAKGILALANYARHSLKLGKVVFIAIVAVLLLIGGYYELQHADSIIKAKVDSYMQVKEAALWMKQASLPGDIIATASISQTTYYAEREVIAFFNFTANVYYTPEEFEAFILAKKPKYLVISAFEPSVPQWTYSFPERNQTRYVPVNAWYEDAAKTKPLLVIYEVKY